MCSDEGDEEEVRKHFGRSLMSEGTKVTKLKGPGISDEGLRIGVMRVERLKWTGDVSG